jgi:hypothetical protein
MLKTIITGALALTTLGTGATAIVLNAQDVSNLNVDFNTTIDTSITYSIDEMLTLAINDEYLAKATYVKLLEIFPDQKMLEHLILAEQRHIDLLLPLFEAYDVVLPEASNQDLTLDFTTIEQAAQSIASAELANIAMYQHFLSQSNLPDDVRGVFEKLLGASSMHLQAAQRVGFNIPARRGMMNGFMNRNPHSFNRGFNFRKSTQKPSTIE